MKSAKVFTACLSLLLCLTACSPDVPAQQDVEKETEETTIEDAYCTVLQHAMDKISYGGGDAAESRGTLYDLDGDGQEELVFYYLYDDVTVVFEAWTYYNGETLQLACVGDLPGIAGAGHPGVSLISYRDTPTIVFWTGNSESYPPGAKENYDLSCWAIRNGQIISGYRMRLEYRTNEEAPEVFSSYGYYIADPTVEDCVEFIEGTLESTDNILLGGAYGEEPIGTPIEQLIETLSA